MFNEKFDIGTIKGTCGNVSWSLNRAESTLSLEGTADETSPLVIDSNMISDSKIMRSIEKVKLGSGITALGDRAFCALSSLNDLTIPQTVKTTGTGIFDGLRIKKLSIEADTEKWGTGWNNGYTELANLPSSGTNGTIKYTWKPDSKTLSVSGTADTTSPFTYEVLPSQLLASVGTLVLGSEITALGNNAFCGFTSLATLTIPATVKNAGKQLFNGIAVSNLSVEADVSVWDSSWASGYKGIGWFVQTDTAGSRTLYVFGTGAIPDYDTAWYTTSLGKSNKMTTAPWKNTDFNKLVIMEGITEIGAYAFYRCETAMTSYAISVSLPSTLTVIQRRALDGMPFQSMTIPSSVIFVGEGAFSFYYSGMSSQITLGWTSSDAISRTLTGLNSDCYPSVMYSDGILYNDNGTAFYNTWSLSNGLLTIRGRGSLSYSVHPWTDSAVTSIIVSSGITSLFSSYSYDSSTMTSTCLGTFQNMPNVTSVTLPDTVSMIEQNCFSGDTSITSILIPSSVTSIASTAFDGWTSSQTIMLGWSSTNTAGHSFSLSSACSAKIYFNDGVQKCDNMTVNTWSFSNGLLTIQGGGTVSYSVHPWTDSAVTSIIVSSGIMALVACSSYDSSTMTSTCLGTFQNMPNVTSVILPDTVSMIEQNCFSGDTSITSILIPSSVSFIASTAFNGWTSSQTITLGWSSTNTAGHSFSLSSACSAKVYYSDGVQYQ